QGCYNETANETKVEYCVCEDPNYVGVFCDIPVCFGLTSIAKSVCSSNGKCIAPNTCICNQNWYGQNCDIAYCYGFFSNDSQVCNGHGDCEISNVCTCHAGWGG